MKKLFWEDPYLTKIQSTVQEIRDTEVLLDQTIIYSFSGGQESDEGTIDGYPVVTSRISNENGNIIYSLQDTDSFQLGKSVTCEINWEKRYRVMKLHSATHIALAILYDMKGHMPVIGANISSEKGRIDFRCNEPLNPLIPRVQEQIDELIKQNLEIITAADSASNNNEKRTWKIGEMGENWIISCGGTHPKQTGEIGAIKLKRKNIGAGKERIEITLLS